MATNPVALQLYTLRDQVAQDYVGTLAAVASIGYRAVELVTLGSMSAAELRAELDQNGLQAPSWHVSIEDFEERFEQVLADAATLGCTYVVFPYLTHEQRATGAAIYHQVAKLLNAAGEQAAKVGVQVCYHHHEFEFEPLDGTHGFEILLNETDPQFVKIEADVYWAAYAGLDPVEFLTNLGDRLALVHLKDMADDADRSFAEVGNGTLDMPQIIETADAGGAAWLIVEQDRCQRPPLESVKLSYDYLKALGRAG